MHSGYTKSQGCEKDCLPSAIVISHERQVKPLPGIEDLQEVFCVGLLGWVFFFEKHLCVNWGDHTHMAASHCP